jgi:hypothetical protein
LHFVEIFLPLVENIFYTPVRNKDLQIINPEMYVSIPPGKLQLSTLPNKYTGFIEENP